MWPRFRTAAAIAAPAKFGPIISLGRLSWLALPDHCCGAAFRPIASSELTRPG
jgi:hypothetical protein